MYRLLLLFCLSSFLLTAQEKTLLHTPAIAPDGQSISFSFQGDIWTMDLDQRQPIRLTIHEAYESNPVFSADGTQLAFESNRFGNADIFTIPAGGGRPERLTYHSTGDELSQWTGSGDLYFTTDRNYQQVSWDEEIYKVSENGGTPVRVAGATGEQPALSPNGRYLAFVRGACRYAREAYQGSANNDIWIYDTENETYHQITTNLGNDFMPRWKSDGELLFISPRNNRYNLRQIRLGEDLEAAEDNYLTDFSEEGVRHFDVAGDKIIMERGASLWLKDGAASAERLEIEIATDYRFDLNKTEKYSSDAEQYDIAPSGEYVCLLIKGEVFVQKLDKEEKRTVNLSDHPYREKKALWLNDSAIIFNSDRNGGQYDLYSVTSADPNKPNLWKSLKHQVTRLTETEADELDFWLSPDGSEIVYQEGPRKLVKAEISAGEISSKETLLDAWNMPREIQWSPDGKYLAYSRPDLNFNSEIYIHPLEGDSDPVNVSMHPRGDRSPFWSPDGSKLGFLSARNNSDYDLWFAWLNRDDWLKTKEDLEEGLYYDKEKDTTKPTENVDIDLDNIYMRLEQVTSLAGNESRVLIGKKGEKFYFTAGSPSASGYDLFSIKYDGSEIKQITKGGTRPRDLQWGPDYKKIYYNKSGVVYSVNPAKGKSQRFSYQARIEHDKLQERKQIFNEVWKLLNQNFYDPDFHGRDWDSLRNRYEERVMSASTNQDFRNMINLMLGQVNASHMGYYNAGEEETQSNRTGLLGAEVRPVKNGLEVLRVVRNSPADRPHSKLVPGDVITAVNGMEVTSETNIYAMLNDYSGDQVLLRIDPAKADVERPYVEESNEVVIRPTYSIRRELYEEWVQERKKLTEKYSDGKLGYIHIQGMDMNSFERFERELTASGAGKEGIIIDVRFNGGGWTTDYLMAVLNVRQHAYTVPRGATDNLTEKHPDFSDYYPYSERLPLSWWTKPAAALCNESSYSNAEIFSHAFKNLGHGPLIGQPTFGAVISTGGTRLMDGSFVRLPFRGWYVKKTGENMEKDPAVPDILVENPPNAREMQEDPQLRKAVERLLEEL